MARRTLNRRDLRDQHEAAERLKEDENEDEDEEETEDEDGDEEDGEEGDDDAGDTDDEDDEGGDDDDDEDAPKKKKKKAKEKAKPKEKAKAKPRSRAAKIVRMRVVWGVFNNSNTMVQKFEYARRDEADALAAKLTGEKKSTHFVQPIKESMEEKKEK